MNKNIAVFIWSFFFFSCNNLNKNKIAEEDLMPDSIPFVELESSNSLEGNNNVCLNTFKALGDTIFGEVLYGMDKKQAINSVRKFQNKLDRYKYKRYKESRKIYKL